MRPRRAAAVVSRLKTTVALQDSDTEATEDYASPAPTPPRSKRRRQVSDSELSSENESHNEEDDDSGEDSSTDTSVHVVQPRRKPRKARIIAESDEDRNNNEDESAGRTTQNGNPPPSDSLQSPQGDHSSPAVLIERQTTQGEPLLGEEEEEEEPLVLNRLSNRSPRKPIRSHRLPSEDDEDSSAKQRADKLPETPPAASMLATAPVVLVERSDDEDLAISPNRRRSLQRRTLRLSPESDNDSAPTARADVRKQTSPSRRRSLQKRQQILSSDSEEDSVPEAEEMLRNEEEELHQELEDLSQSLVVAERTRPRNRPTAFSKTLDTLKRRRSLNHGKEDSDDQQDHTEGPGSFDENEEINDTDEADDDIDSEEDFIVDRHDARLTGDYEFESSQISGVQYQDDLDFVTEDASQDTPDMRQMFKLSNRQKLSVDFKVYCQYLLNLIFDREFDSRIKHDEYFQSSITHVARTIETYQNSLSNSQVWDKQFKRDMETHPEYTSDYCGGHFVNCQACTISNRPATFRVILSGTFEDWPELQPEHSGDESEDERSSQEGEAAEDPKCIYYLGRFCHNRSKNYHAFYHWKFHVVQRMTIKVNEYMPKPFSSMSQEELDAVDTNEVMELLESSGYVSRLWHQLKDLMNKARTISPGAD
ncbi:hypothetical protein BGZ73_006699 [Actinomortierella ambigua]|nr:hypothetical protein BGZ73_006699 [Actinomortierella ambigua]